MSIGFGFSKVNNTISLIKHCNKAIIFLSPFPSNDRAHSLNLLAQKCDTNGMNSPGVASMITRITSKQNQSDVFKKALSIEIKKLRDNTDPLILKLIRQKYNQCYVKLHTECTTRFTAKSSYFGAFWQLKDAVLECFEREDIKKCKKEKEDKELIILGKAFKRFVCNSQNLFDLEILTRFYSISAEMNRKAQSEKISCDYFLTILEDYKREIIALKDELENNCNDAKSEAQKYYEKYGREVYNLRSNDNFVTSPNSQQFEDAIDFCTEFIDNTILAEKSIDRDAPIRKHPCYAISSMSVERYFR